jgi:hypothetical protein
MPAPRILPPAAGPVLLGALVLFSAYMAYEVWRWTSGNRAMLTPGQFRRRIFTGLLLEVDLVLWLLANPAIASFRRANPEHWGAPTLLYLLTATLLVFIPMLLAVREAAFIMRQYARWRGEVVRNLGKPDRRGENGSS